MASGERLTKIVGEYCRGFASEDGNHYRTERQNMKPVLDHVKHLDDKVNSAPKAGNKNEMQYVGSIPLLVLTDWLKDNGYLMEHWARDEDRCKQKFMSYLKTEMPAFLAKQKKASQILMPR